MDLPEGLISEDGSGLADPGPTGQDCVVRTDVEAQFAVAVVENQRIGSTPDAIVLKLFNGDPGSKSLRQRLLVTLQARIKGC